MTDLSIRSRRRTARRLGVRGVIAAAVSLVLTSVALQQPASAIVTAPDAITTAVVASKTASSVTLSWSAPANNGAPITDYQVQYSADLGANWQTFGESVSSTPSITVSGLARNVLYLFEVRALNSAGWGDWSTDISARPAVRASAPTNLRATDTTTSSISVAWTTPDDGGSPILDYIVQYSTDGTVWSTFVHAPAPLAVAMTITGLVPGTKYRVRVAAVTDEGSGALATISDVYAATAPGAPTLSLGAIGETSVALSWSIPDAGGLVITDYVVQYSLNGSTWTTFTDGTSTTPSTTVTGLAKNTSYLLRVTAVNAVGQGAWSNVVSIGLTSLPGAPTGLSYSAKTSTSVTLIWSASAENGHPITDYVAQYSLNGTTWLTFADAVSPLTSATVTGLTTATSYQFRVAGTSSEGTGPWSDPIIVTAATRPAAPGGFGVSAKTEISVSLAWLTPDNGGYAITDYKVKFSTNGSTWTDLAPGPGTSLTATVSGLTRGTNYWFSVAATNSEGTGPAAIITVIPAVPAAAPTLALPTRTTTSVGLSWTVGDDGGRPITDYVIQYNDGSGTWRTFADGTSTALSASVTGLTRGVLYTFRVAALTGEGVGTWSATQAGRLAAPPSAPTQFKVTSHDRTTVSLAWSTPLDVGASGIDFFEVDYSSDGGVIWTAADDSIPSGTFTADVTGLTQGVAYQFRVLARSTAEGDGPATTLTDTPAGVPDAPTTLVIAAKTVTSLSIGWTAPDDNGGRPIVDYVIRYKPTTSVSWTTLADAVSTLTRATIGGLSSAVYYDVEVAAVNLEGTGAWVALGAPEQPSDPPGAPLALTVLSFDSGSATLDWNAPAVLPAAPHDISDYLVEYSTNGVTWTAFTHPPSDLTETTVDGLRPGRTYRFRVAAVNDAGPGVRSNVVSASLPAVIPEPPVLTGTAGRGSVSLSWTVPDDGGAAVSQYSVWMSRDGGLTWRVVTRTPKRSSVIRGLKNGSSYRFYVTAKNRVGTSSGSFEAILTPQTLPTAPWHIIATPASGQLTIDWYAPKSNGGAAITDYIIEVSVGYRPWTVIADGVSTSTSYLLTNLPDSTPLVDGQKYRVRVRAVNAVGTGPVSPIVSGVPRS